MIKGRACENEEIISRNSYTIVAKNIVFLHIQTAIQSIYKYDEVIEDSERCGDM
jgi:hypothetical protein